MNSGFFDSIRSRTLQWMPELGIGWYPVEAAPYDGSYWTRYRQMDYTPTGDQLTESRIDLVSEFWNGEVVDIGIGGGRFVTDRPLTYGYDINPLAVDWLKSHDRWADPYHDQVPAVTFWDSLEHIHDPRGLLNNVMHYIFISLPIFTGPDHILRSRHFRRDEHCWYFTRKGLVNFMSLFGFRVLHQNSMEQLAGREDIESFVFARVK